MALISSLTFNPIYSLWVIALIAAGLLSLLAVGPNFGSLTLARNRILLLLRATIFLGLLICMLRPGFVVTIQKPQKAVLNLLIDLSRSMELTHRNEESTRIEALKKALNEARPALQSLRNQNIELKAFGFDRELLPLKFEKGIVEIPIETDGSQTDMGTSLDSSMKGSRGKRLIGTILMGDGVQNVDAPQVNLQQAIKSFRDLEIPLYTVPFGQEGNAGQFPDLAITNMSEQFSVNVKNELIVNATLQTRGFVNRSIPVQLKVIDQQGKETVVQTLNKQITRKEQQIDLEFGYVPETPGRYTIEVEAATQASELVTKNNSLPAFLNVDEKGIRILYIHGKEGLEQLFLKKSIGAAQGIDMDVVYIDPATQSRWPLDRNELFEKSLYDVVILHDLHSTALFEEGNSRSSLETLVTEIQKGKGFMMIGGNHSFDGGRYGDTPLGKILPVNLEENAFRSNNLEQRIAAFHVPGPITLQAARPHYLTKVSGVGETTWQKLPPLSSLNRFVSLKDQARVLLEGADKEPVLIQGNYGGRVLLFAGDSSWKWWTSGNKEFHKRFWRQVILWLARRDGLGNDNIWVNLEQRRVEPQTTLEFNCEATSTLGDRIANANFSATVKSPDGTENPVSIAQLEKEGAGKIDGELLTAPGTYELTVSANKSGSELGETKVEFVVIDRDSEKANPVADPNQLARISSQTANWGGRSVQPEELKSLLEEIVEQREDEEIEVKTKWQLGDTFPDAFLVIILFASFFGVEWFLRKKWGLV